VELTSPTLQCLPAWNNYKLTCSIPGSWIGLPNSHVPYWCVFPQLSSRSFAPLQDTPLKSRQSAKIRTTVVWGAWERKSRSNACRRSNVGLPICLYPFLMQSAVLQIFIKVLNTVYHSFQLRCIHCDLWYMQKPNLTTVSGELRFRELLLICGLPTTSILPDFMCK